MEQTYCQHVALTQEPVIVVDAREHSLVQELFSNADGMPLAYLGQPVFTPDGQVVGGLCLMQPDTRQWTAAEINSAKKLAACLSDLILLKAAMLTSEQLRREQRDFTYAISHDLKSPTNTLHLIFDEVSLEKDSLSDDIQTLLSEGQSTIIRMQQQVEDVLKYSRIVDVGRTIETIELNTIVDEVLQDLKFAIHSTQANISVSALPAIQGDRIQLRTLFHNLIGNALKFNVIEKKPVISVTASVDNHSHQHLIMVKDNGIGIAIEDQTSVFKLFNRLHLRGQFAGTGIGLALCHRVMDNHDGSIKVPSDGQTGSTFTISFPEKQS